MPRVLEAKLLAEGKKFAIVVSRFNDFITETLVSGALDPHSGGSVGGDSPTPGMELF